MRNTLAALVIGDFWNAHAIIKPWRSFFIDIYSLDWNLYAMSCALHTFAEQINHFFEYKSLVIML